MNILFYDPFKGLCQSVTIYGIKFKGILFSFPFFINIKHINCQCFEGNNAVSLYLCNESYFELLKFKPNLQVVFSPSTQVTVTVLKIFFAVSSTSTVPVTTSGATTATLSTTPETSINPVACIPVTTNNISLEEFNVIVEGLKISKSNTSSHKRSLTCAYDPRPSSKAIGGVGIGLICSVFVFIFIMDCTTIKKKNRIIEEN